MSTTNSLTALKHAPGKSGQPYILESLCGEVIYIPLSKSATRLLVTGKESENAFAVVGTGGTSGDPIGFHFHREAHDVFLCLKGSVKIWAGDQCRILGPDDFASVPPGVVHQYQILGDRTEFVGLIVPGGWEEFFRFIGEPYDGPIFPLEDNRNFVEVLLPKLIAASEKFDMVPVRDHPGAEATPWADDEDCTLPGDLKPYFLRAGTAPRWLLGGVICSILAGPAESAGRFSIGTIEGSSWHKDGPLSKEFIFEEVHHAFQIAEGTMEFRLGSQSAVLGPGETMYVPRGQSFSVTITSRYARSYVFISGTGLLTLLAQAGKSTQQMIIPEKADTWDLSGLQASQKKLRCTVE